MHHDFEREHMRKNFILTLLPILILASVQFSHAQQTKKAVIGILTLASDDPLAKVLREGLRDLGYIEGQNIVFEHRYVDGKVERLSDLAAELVRMKVDIIVARSTPVVQAVKKTTTTIPVVISVPDSVGSGFVASLARPGGNITGTSSIMPELAGKRLELLREILPKISRVAFLAHAGDPSHPQFIKELQDAAESARLQVQPMVVKGAEEFESAFSVMARERAGAVIVQPLFAGVLGVAGPIAELAMKNRLPTISDGLRFADAGGMIYYGPDQLALWRAIPTYVDKILKGAKPADLPVEQPTKFELIINLKTAKQIGLAIPPSVLARADKVIR
jgi:putative tryptophan/tyrosine transport system substrate-binding protein